MSNSTVYIGLGSNIKNPSGQIQSALNALDNHQSIELITCAHLYSSAPMGPKNQPDYTNSVCKISTTLTPIELLDVTQAIELEHGRERKAERWGPRTLDLDILLYDQQQIDTERLVIPHYGMATREFVLVPLFEIEPDLIMPDTRPLSAWVAECNLVGLRRLTKPSHTSRKQ